MPFVFWGSIAKETLISYGRAALSTCHTPRRVARTAFSALNLAIAACAPAEVPTALGPDGAALEPTDASTDALDRSTPRPLALSTDASRAGPAPIFPVADAGSDAGKPLRCVDLKVGGWGSSGGGCGSHMHYRCGSVRYSVECSGGHIATTTATCVCKTDGRVVGEIVEPHKGCGDTEGARDLCGLPEPR
jgi:hypothetical protein